MNKLIKLPLFLFITLSSSHLWAEKVQVHIVDRDEPLECFHEESQYFCHDGENFLFGRNYGMDLYLTGSVDGSVDDFRVSSAVSLDNPDHILFEEREDPYRDSYEQVNRRPSYSKELMSLTMLENMTAPFSYDSESIALAKSNLYPLVQNRLDQIKNKFNQSNRIVKTEEGNELSCSQGSASAGQDVNCTFYQCTEEGSDKKYFYISDPNIQFGVHELFSVGTDGLPQREAIQSIHFPNDDKSILERFNFVPSAGQGFGEYTGQGDFLSNEYSYQKPQIDYEQMIPDFDNPKKSDAFKYLIGVNGRGAMENAVRGCSERTTRDFFYSIDDLMENVLARNSVQYITDFNNGLAGYYLSLENLPDIACSENGVFYNPSSYETARNVAAADRNSVQTISMEKARELFDKAQAMDDIAWGYKPDGCYARAHLMARRFEEMGITVDKAWLKGSLRAQGETPEEDIMWNFHVAPVVYVEHDNGEIERVVIDPSVEDGPVTAMEWAKNLSSDVEERVNITQFPYPENSAEYLKNSLAFSNSDPYLPLESTESTEEQKMSMAHATMLEYKGYE